MTKPKKNDVRITFQRSSEIVQEIDPIDQEIAHLEAILEKIATYVPKIENILSNKYPHLAENTFYFLK